MTQSLPPQPENWTWDKENYDFARIPDGYKDLRGDAIDMAIRAGVRMIPGIKIFPENKP